MNENGPAAKIEWSAESERFREALPPERIGQLAVHLGVTAESLVTLGVGWATSVDLRRMVASGKDWQESYPDGAFTFPERDGSGRIVGWSLRATDGRKGAPSKKYGARRGLIVPNSHRERSDPVLIVEGASDTAACEAVGIAAIGRPSNGSGVADLARLLKNRRILIIGENDQKEHGEWPGRDGAARVASRIATDWDEPVDWALPPVGVKDIRAWLQACVAGGLNLVDQEACRAAGVELLATLQARATKVKPEKKPPQSELIVRLALERYRIGLAVGDEPFAVPIDGPNLALMFRGARDALRSALSCEYRRRYGKTPSASALADALTALQGEAYECAPETIYLRVGEHADATVLDLGRADGRCVVIHPGRWELCDVSPVLFRRTALTSELVEPERGGDVRLLRELLNVSDETWPMVVGWLVAAYLLKLPHPILMLGGPQGTGKSTAARYLVGLFDPSTAPLRSQPSNVEQWAVVACGSWGVCIDNVSSLSDWISDTLCKAVTGDGLPKRKLYTDSDITVLNFRRVLVMTSIDAGALRGDFGDRLVLADLFEIDELRRRSESELDALYAEHGSKILGALLDIVATVIERLPSLRLKSMPRMADFTRVLAAMDEVLGTNAVTIYVGQSGRIASDVIEADPVGAAIVSLIDSDGAWHGTATELYKQITPDKAPQRWPKSPATLSSRLRRLEAPLKGVGVAIEFGRENQRGRSRRIKIERQAANAVQSVQASDGPVPDGTEANPDTTGLDAVADNADDAATGKRPATEDATALECALVRRESMEADAPDTMDGNSRHASNGDEPCQWTG